MLTITLVLKIKTMTDVDDDNISGVDDDDNYVAGVACNDDSGVDNDD